MPPADSGTVLGALSYSDAALPLARATAVAPPRIAMMYGVRRRPLLRRLTGTRDSGTCGSTTTATRAAALTDAPTALARRPVHPLTRRARPGVSTPHSTPGSPGKEWFMQRRVCPTALCATTVVPSTAGVAHSGPVARHMCRLA